jgi:hypothetical protein
MDEVQKAWMHLGLEEDELDMPLTDEQLSQWMDSMHL